MPSQLRQIWRLFQMEWATKLQYRADLLLWLTAEALTPLVSLAVWYTVASSSPGPLSPNDTIAYYILVIFVVIISQAWNGFFFAREILTGELGRLLIKPIPVMWHHITDNISEKVVKLLLPVPLFLLALWQFPAFFDSLSRSVSVILAFLASLLLAAIISFSFDMCLGALAFWLEDANQLREYQYIFREVTSGVIFPLILLPPVIRVVFNWLPFRYMISAPIEIILGQHDTGGILTIVGIQVLWAGSFSLVLALLWRQGLKRYAIPGQ